MSDVQKGLAMFQQSQIGVPILGIVENMAYFTPEELPENKYYIFGKDGGKQFADKHDVPLLAEIPIVQGIREGGDNGKPIATSDSLTAEAFETLAQKVAQQVAIKNANKQASTPVEMN
jgi:ATP-binding protein involved in chromosome partitioning